MKFKKLHSILFPLVLGFLILSLSSYYPGGISGRTTTASGGCSCHGASNNATTVSVTGPTGYLNGQALTFTVNVTNVTMAAAGFDLKCNIGTITSVGTGVTLSSATEITHNAPRSISSGTASWTFQWTAPATGNTQLQFNVVGNAVNSNGSTSGDAWSFGIVPSIPLPIDFESFNVLCDKKSIKGFWDVSDPKNIQHFEIEKSVDGLNFDLWLKTTAVEGKKDYQFEDKEIIAHQTYFYRIKEVMKNGSSNYTETKSALFSDAENTIILYPNVISDNQLHIKGIDFSKAKHNLQIVSLAGKLMYQTQLQQNGIQLPDNLKPGSYIARILIDQKLIYAGFIFKR